MEDSRSEMSCICILFYYVWWYWWMWSPDCPQWEWLRKPKRWTGIKLRSPEKPKSKKKKNWERKTIICSLRPTVMTTWCSRNQFFVSQLIVCWPIWPYNRGVRQIVLWPSALQFRRKCATPVDVFFINIIFSTNNSVNYTNCRWESPWSVNHSADTWKQGWQAAWISSLTFWLTDSFIKYVSVDVKNITCNLYQWLWRKDGEGEAAKAGQQWKISATVEVIVQQCFLQTIL